MLAYELHHVIQVEPAQAEILLIVAVVKVKLLNELLEAYEYQSSMVEGVLY